jgi:hypothetical protein
MKFDNKLVTVGIIIVVLFLILCAVLIGFGNRSNQPDNQGQDPYVRCAAESSTLGGMRCKECLKSGGTWSGVGCLDEPYYEIDGQTGMGAT